MKDKKYHVSSSGFLSLCEAYVRACPRGGQHYTAEEYNTMVKQGDVRVPISPDPKAGSNLAEAQAAYTKAAKVYYSPEVQRFQQAEMKKRKIDTESVKKTSEESHSRYNKLSNYTRRFLEQNGVQYWDVMRVNRLMEHSTDFEPLKDHYDKDLNKVIDSLVADPKFVRLRDKAVAARESRNNAEALHVAVEERFSRTEASRELLSAETELQRTKKWARAGIHDDAKMMSVENIAPDMLSYDKDGTINNVWANENGRIRQVGSLDGRKWDDRRTGFIGTDGAHIYPSSTLIVGPLAET